MQIIAWFCAFWIFYVLDFLVFYDHVIGEMTVTPRSVEEFKVGHAVIFFLHRIKSLLIYCDM